MAIECHENVIVEAWALLPYEEWRSEERRYDYMTAEYKISPARWASPADRIWVAVWDVPRKSPTRPERTSIGFGSDGIQGSASSPWSYENYDNPVDLSELELDLSIFIRAVERIFGGSELEELNGTGKFERSGTTRIIYETACGQRYRFRNDDMTALIAWATSPE